MCGAETNTELVLATLLNQLENLKNVSGKYINDFGLMTNYYFGCRIIHLSAEIVATIFADNIEIKKER